jgi:multiple sugar transport system substrate-binding protein
MLYAFLNTQAAIISPVLRANRESNNLKTVPVQIMLSILKKGVSLLLLWYLLLGCSGGDQKRVTFAVGGAPNELVYWEKVIAAFERQSQVQVEMLRKPSNTDLQRQSLIISLKAEISDPDVFLMDVAWVGLFAAASWLEPLGEDFDRSPFFQTVIQSVDTMDGKLIALPVYMDGGVLYYRKDLLKRAGIDAPPKTWGELLSSAKRVQEQVRTANPNFYGFVWTGAQYEGLITVFMEFAGAEGGFIRNGAGVRLTSPENLAAVSFMRDLIWKDHISPPNTYTTMREEEVRTYFQEGNGLYERNWPYAWSLHQAGNSKVRGKTGVVPVPGPQENTGVSTLGGFHIGVSAFSDAKGAAKEFVKFVTSFTSQKEMVLSLGWNPGRQDLYREEEVLTKAPHFRELMRVFRRSRPRPLVPYYSQISAVAQKHINGVLANKVSAQQALTDADKEIEALLSRYRLE